MCDIINPHDGSRYVHEYLRRFHVGTAVRLLPMSQRRAVRRAAGKVSPKNEMVPKKAVPSTPMINVVQLQ
ncbi:hypothetical protein WSS15_27220 [Acetobacter pasteurianus]|nr:hypothetical protein WSS15_27220 [Acetobacter pasteurianus]